MSTRHVVNGKPLAEPLYPDTVQARITKWFGTVRVDWCFGEDERRWDGGFVHWLEVYFGKDPIRGWPVGYTNVARITCNSTTYVGFSAYWQGELPIEQPVQLQVGQDQ